MKSIIVNENAKILEGYCSGLTGKVIAFEKMSNEVYIHIDSFTTVITTLDNVEQQLYQEVDVKESSDTNCIYCHKKVTKGNEGFQECSDVCLDCAINMVGIDESDT